jgi:hypothetical protein
MTDVVVVANDVVPGLGLPVAAPGLRAHGLAAGLRSHGIEAVVTVPSALVAREWSNRFDAKSWPSGINTVVLPDAALASFIDVARPRAVILTNSNRFDIVGSRRGTRYVYDFFAPKMKELEESPIADRDRQLAALRARKLRALDRADAVIVNGTKKVPYVLDWLAQTNRGLDGRRIEVVNMPIEPNFQPPAADEFVHMVLAGYLAPWLRFGNSLDVLFHVMEDRPALMLHLWMPEHWGSAKPEHRDVASLCRLQSHPRTRTRGTLLFEDFQYCLSRMDLFVDVFLRSPEREIATVTRTVTAIACGVPVLHPTFTECSPLIAEYDAGWLIDATKENELGDLLTSIVSDRAVLAHKRPNVRRLAEQVYAPSAATAPLADLVKSWR